MKLLYVANVRMPTERAHGIQIMKTAAALTKTGVVLELLVPRRMNSIEEDAFSYYGLKESFPILKIPVVDTVSWGKFGFILESLSFAFSALRYAERAGLVYGRDELVLAVIALFTKRAIVWESHTGSWNGAARFVARRAKKIVVISNGLRDFYVAQGIAPERIVVAPDAIDLDDFQNTESKEEARTRLGLPLSDRVALYIGGFGGWKGTETFFKASTHLPDGMLAAAIGGSPEEIVALKEKYPRVRFLGAQPYSKIGDNQSAADVLVLPNTARDLVSRHFTSPLKLFTYMASGKPIVASDIASIREVLPDEAAYWFRADDAEDLARAIEEALADPGALQRAAIAQEAVKRYTWEARARLITEALTD